MNVRPIDFSHLFEAERVQSIECGGEVIEVWYLKDSGGYEWVLRDAEGRVLDGSVEGFTMLAVALQAGLNRALGPESGGSSSVEGCERSGQAQRVIP